MTIKGAVFGLGCCLSLVGSLAPACAGTPDEFGKWSAALIDSLKQCHLNISAPHAISKLKVESGPASIIFDQGVIFPADAIGGKVREFVFVGQGRFQFKAPDAVEGRQLELFTGSLRIEEPFESIVIGVGQNGLEEQLLQLPVPAADSAEAARSAEALFLAWRQSPERKKWGIEAKILETLLDQTAFGSFFTAWVEGTTLNRFLYGFFPGNEEQIVLGQFVPMKATEEEWDFFDRRLASAKIRFRKMDLDLRDYGAWDSWVETSERDESGSLNPGGAGFAARHYDLDISLGDNDLLMTGRCSVSIEVTKGGRHVVPFVLSSDLDVDDVTFQGREKGSGYYRFGDRLYVILPEPTEAGRRFEVEIRYHGEGLVKSSCGTGALWSTASWYPQIPGSNRSTFQMTYHFPKDFQVAGGGIWQERGLDSAERAWERWTVDRPVLSLTFGIGDFQLMKGRAGHVDVTLVVDLIANNGKSLKPDFSAEDLLSTVLDAMDYFEKEFGSYPLDYLTVVAVPGTANRSSLGWVALNDTFRLVDQNASFSQKQDEPRMVVAHELARQWWGEAVRLNGPRDQWLGEAMATLASDLYAKNRLKPDIQKQVIPVNLRWKSAMRTWSERGQAIDSLGPVLLSQRLVSSLEDDYFALNRLVAVKGAMVLNTMAETFKNSQDFGAVLQTVFKSWSGKAISTEKFIEACSEAAGIDFGPVVRSLVYETGVPEVYYSYTIEPAPNGEWLLKGEAHKLSAYPPQYRFSLRMAPEGGVDVVRSGVIRPAEETSVTVAPIQIVLEGSDSIKKRSKVVLGKLVLKGPVTPFEFQLPNKPTALLMDPESRVLAFFHNEQLTPKRVLFYRGRWALGMGDPEGALTLFRRALDAPVSTDPAVTHPVKHSKALEKRVAKKLIHQQMARAYLDMDQADLAVKEMKATERNWSVVEPYLRIEEALLEARLASRRGDFQKVFALLEGSLDFGKLAFNGMVLELRKDRPGLKLLGTEAMALLAVAAQRTGHLEHFKEASRLAKRGGADLSLLK